MKKKRKKSIRRKSKNKKKSYKSKSNKKLKKKSYKKRTNSKKKIKNFKRKILRKNNKLEVLNKNKNGIILKSDWSFWIKILSIAGSKSQAIAEVLPATSNEKNMAKKICFRYFFV